MQGEYPKPAGREQDLKLFFSVTPAQAWVQFLFIDISRFVYWNVTIHRFRGFGQEGAKNSLPRMRKSKE
jgi:hypothetical protein